MADVKVRRLLDAHKRQKHKLRKEICKLEKYRSSTTNCLKMTEQRDKGDKNLSDGGSKKISAQGHIEHRDQVERGHIEYRDSVKRGHIEYRDSVKRGHIEYINSAERGHFEYRDSVERRHKEYRFPTNNASCEDLSAMTEFVLSRHKRRKSETNTTTQTSYNTDWRRQQRYKLPQLRPLNRRHVPNQTSLAIRGEQLAALPDIQSKHYNDEDGAEARAARIMNNVELTDRHPKVQPPCDEIQRLYDKYELEDRTWADNYEYELLKLQTVAKVQDWLCDNPVAVQAFQL